MVYSIGAMSRVAIRDGWLCSDGNCDTPKSPSSWNDDYDYFDI